MKITIISAHLIFGFALILNSIFPIVSNIQLANRNNFSDSMANTAFPTEQIYVEKCMVAGGNPTPEKCRAEYSDITKYNEQTRKEETGYAKENLISIVTPFILMILAGIISVISAIGFLKFRKWSAIGLVISSFVALAISLYWSFAILLGFGEFQLLLVPLAIIIWIVIEGLYIKKNWRANISQGIV